MWPGHRVDRLGLAPVPRGHPGVEQDAARGQRGRAVGVEHRHPTRPDVDVARGAVAVPGSTGRPAATQAGETAVEHAHLVMPGPAQGPPQSGGGLAVAGVVDDDRVPRPYAGGAQRL